MNASSEVVLYQAPDGEVQLDVRLERETVWLSQRQMAVLFKTSSENISLHLKNIYKDGELEESATTEDYSAVQREGRRGVRRKLKHYNLDAIISVGYRVNTKRGIQFRIWATRTLRDHLLRGYSLNEKRLREKGLGEIEQAVGLLARTLTQHALVTDEGRRLRRENLSALSLRIGRTGNRTNRADSRTNSKKEDVERCRRNQTSQAPA